MAIYPTGTVTFLFSDIEGSTKLAQEHPGTWETLREKHHAILRSAMEANHGHIFKIIGDAFCVAFYTAGEALQAAVDSQIGLSAQNWGETPIKVRMGIHTGQARLQENGEYLGYLAMSQVQRLMSAGHGGQVLVSPAACELVRDVLPENVSIVDLGEHRLKDLSRPGHLYQANIAGLNTDFPPLKTLDTQLNNLPVQLTPFLGRAREIAAVTGLLRNPAVRLVTLTGAGGSGKTRLSLQVAAELLDEYEHGVWFVELASITDPQLFLDAVASTFNLKESAARSIEQTVHEYLGSRNLLLVLDNFEQIVSAAPAAGRLMKAAPKIKVLVSSRAVLRLSGEHGYPVPPLGLPEGRVRQSAAVLAQYEAIALFIQHARAANPAFELNDENAASVAEICTRLDGLPLAIELAAARSRMLNPAFMLEKLKSRLNVLTGGARDLPQRQQTMRDAIGWSYDLLEDAEKTLFARLGIFNGGWTLESAEEVCGAGLTMEVLNGLEALLDKSLVRQNKGSHGEPRFSMLETIREYALEKLAEQGGLDSIQQNQAKYMQALLQKVDEAKFGPEEEPWFTRLDDELDNLRSVVAWALSHRQFGIIFRVGRLDAYWRPRTNIREPLTWLEAGLAMQDQGSPAERAAVMTCAGIMLNDLGEYQLSRTYHESALALYRRLDDSDGIAISLNDLGSLAWVQEKDYEKARLLYEQVLALGKETNSLNQSMLLNNLGSLARIRGDIPAAREYHLRSRAMCEAIGSEMGISFADWYLGRLELSQRNLVKARIHFQNHIKAGWLDANPLAKRNVLVYHGYILLLQGQAEEARKILNDSLDSLREFLKQYPVSEDSWIFLEGKARLDLGEENPERAAVLLGASWRERKSSDFPVTEAERPDYEACLAETRAALGEAAYEAAFQKGQAMSLKEAVEFALDPLD